MRPKSGLELNRLCRMGPPYKVYAHVAGHMQGPATDDVAEGSAIMLSLFVRNPQFQGQTKEPLFMPEATRLVEQLMGRKPELRLAFIQENARFVKEIDVLSGTTAGA